MFSLRTERAVRKTIVVVILFTVGINLWVLLKTESYSEPLHNRRQAGSLGTASIPHAKQKNIEPVLRRDTLENEVLGDGRRQSPHNNGRQQAVSPQHSHEKRGFVIGVSFWDQQTFSTSNILSLMCWAGSIGAVVVQPYMIASLFQVPLAKDVFTANETVTQLQDLYDIDFWNTASTKRGYAPLVAWQNFFQTAPRSVTLVYIKSSTKRSCELDLMHLQYSSVLEAGGFNVQRLVCLKENRTSELLSSGEFYNEVYGNYLPNETTVIFQEWSSSISRIADLRAIKCSPIANTFNLAVITPSQRAIQDSDTYIRNYISREGVYLAVLLRLEWIIHYKREFKEVLYRCMNATNQHLIAAKSEKKLSSTFVGVDIGKYGSTTENNLKSDIVFAEVERLFRSVSASSLSVAHLEESFSNVTHSTNSGYIAFLQKLIASRGACLITLGGGSFQKHALSLYKATHAAGQQCFITLNSECAVSASQRLST